MNRRGAEDIWRLTWPVLPLIFVFTIGFSGVGSFVPHAVIDMDTGSLSTLTVMEHRAEFGVSPEMGRWWIGDGTFDAQFERWPILIDEVFQSVVRVVGIVLVVGLALVARWPWEFRAPGVRRRQPWQVIAWFIGFGIAFVSGAHGMHYLLYGEFISFGQSTEENRALLYGSFSTSINFYSGLVLAPVAEEIVFRGWLQRILTPICKVWPALLLQAVVFGAAHFDYQGFNGFVITGGIGLLLGLVFLYSGKLWPCILCHSLINLFGSAGDIWWFCTGRPD